MSDSTIATVQDVTRLSEKIDLLEELVRLLIKAGQFSHKAVLFGKPNWGGSSEPIAIFDDHMHASAYAVKHTHSNGSRFKKNTPLSRYLFNSVKSVSVAEPFIELDDEYKWLPVNPKK